MYLDLYTNFNVLWKILLYSAVDLEGKSFQYQCTYDEIPFQIYKKFLYQK